MSRADDAFRACFEARRDALPGEDDHLELPRVVFEHTRSNFARLRLLIDRINSFADDA